MLVRRLPVIAVEDSAALPCVLPAVWYMMALSPTEKSTASYRPTEGDVLVLCRNQSYGAFVLNLRVDLHAIDATPARWRGDVGSSPLDGASAATSSPRNDLVKNYRVHPTHRLISTQVPARILRRVPAALCPRRAREEAGRGETAPGGAPARPQRRRLVARRPCPCCTDFSVVVASIGGGALPLASMA